LIPTPPNAWPTERPEPDCWGGDEYLFDRSNYENHCAFTGQAIENLEAYDQLDRRFMKRWFEVVNKGLDRADGALQEMAHLLGLPATPHHDKRPSKIAPIHLEALQVWEMLENGVPDVVMIALDRVLGPYADEVLHRDLHRIAVEAFAFSPTVDIGLPATKRWAQDVLRPSPEIRAAMRAFEHSPAMLWEVTEQGECTPLLPLADAYCPSGSVLGEPQKLPRCKGETLVARIAPIKDGTWQILGGLWVHAPPLAGLLERLELEHLRLSRHERRLTWEDLLRFRAELLYRLCATYSAQVEN